MTHTRGFTGALLVALASHPAFAQPPVYSLGQPPRWQPYAAAAIAWDRTPAGSAANILAGIQRPLTNPVPGLLAGAGELYATTGGAYRGGGLRAIARSPALALGLGLDLNVGEGRTGTLDLLLSYQSAIRRGGLLGRGTMLRVDWLPGRRQTLSAGITVPLFQPLAGRTRPHETQARLPSAGSGAGWAAGPLPPETESALEQLSAAAAMLRRYGSLTSGADARALNDRSYETTHGAYHDALARAFGTSSRRAGEPIARRARAGLLDAVLVPYDSLFGRPKSSAADIRGLTDDAQGRFARWVRDSSQIAPEVQPAVLITHARWLSVIERTHRELLAQWRDSRLVWLPLSLALRAEDHDEQEEVDGLIARLVGRPFTDGNALSYLRGSDLPVEVGRSVLSAREYHVLWVHDFTGLRDGTKSVDKISLDMVTEFYLPALTGAVKRYDQTGRIPLYMIMLDQHFYEKRNGRLFMTMLEDPLHARMKLPAGNEESEARLRARQAELRAAVDASQRLQSDAGARGGSAWLRGLVKVHVNVVLPSDFSFRSHHTIPPLPFSPDNIKREHRKLVIYDITEAEPYRGAMILMGIGIGEHYTSVSWEDRGYRLRGPATLEARDALRRLLRRNGFAEGDIPEPLRANADERAEETRMDRGDYVGRALQVHNEAGFGRKHSSVVRAALYDLAQPGSIVVVPDPLWLSAEWAAMLAGAAARGAQVHIIAPALANAPSSGATLMALAHEVLTELLAVRADMQGALRESKGELRIALFAARAKVDDLAGRRREVREGLARAPWIKTLIPFDAQTLSVLDRAETQGADGRDATARADDEEYRPPQLHQKTQLIARPGAIAVLAAVPGWEHVLAGAMQIQSQQTARVAEQTEWETPPIDSAATRRTDSMLRAFESLLPEAERKRFSFYFTVGTQNQDPRGIVSDGEATIVTSGFAGVTGLVDLYYMMARSTWIDSTAELDRLLPPPSGFWRWLARLVRPAL